MISKETLIFDIETDSLDIESANLKWFGAYSYKDNKFIILDFNNKDKIKDLISNHKYIITFNGDNFDVPITKNYFNEDVFNYKVQLDLFQCLKNKRRLSDLNIQTESFSLNNIIQVVGLGEIKGEIDYKVFQKNSWNENETEEIKKYLKKDLILTKKLFEWYYSQFEPLEDLIDSEDYRKLKHLKCTTGSLAYQIVCKQAGLEVEWNDNKPEKNEKILGAHHIEPRKEINKGNIISIDFTSMYPHNLMMGNLFTQSEEGWNGNNYFNLKGTYNTKELGKIESVIKDIFLKRLEAKQKGDKQKSLAYKLIINSIYGSTGNYAYKHFYNPTTANDCTSMGRTLLRKLAAKLEANGFFIIYGFTDGLYLQIPEPFNKDILKLIINGFIEEVKKNVPFPMETFGLEIEGDYKFFWILKKNCYLWITKDGNIGYRNTLLNKNAPEVVLNVFDNYISEKIKKELDVNFTEEELVAEVKKRLNENPLLAAETFNAKDLDFYKIKTSINYQISEKYGEGQHYLIPNTAMVGVGSNKGTKKKKPVRYCSVEDFNSNNLSVEDIDISKIMKWLKPFLREKSSEKHSQECLGAVYPICNEKIKNDTENDTESDTESDTENAQLSQVRSF